MTSESNRFELPFDQEQKLIALLDEIHVHRATLPDPEGPIRKRDSKGQTRELTATEQAIVRLEGQVLETIDKYFRSCLPGLFVKMFGTGVVKGGAGDVMRMTEMLNTFFLRLLEKRPDQFWRARTAKDLRKWASVVNKNLLIDVLRREKRGREVLQEHALHRPVEVGPELPPEAGSLLSERSRHFQKTSGIPLDDRVFDQLERWLASEDRVENEMGSVLQYRYLDGMPYSEIANMLSLSEGTVQARRRAALDWLKSHIK